METLPGSDDFIQKEYVQGNLALPWYFRANGDGRYGRYYLDSDKPVEVTGRFSDALVTWQDGEQWGTIEANGLVVSLNVRRSSEYGHYYQVSIMLDNHRYTPVLLDPVKTTAAYYIADLSDALQIKPLRVLTYEEYKNRVETSQMWQSVAVGVAAGLSSIGTASTTTYHSGNYSYSTTTYHRPSALPDLMYAGLADSWKQDRAIIDKGYIKKNTIQPGECIAGSFMVKAEYADAPFLLLVLSLEDAEVPVLWNIKGQPEVVTDVSEEMDAAMETGWRRQGVRYAWKTNSLDLVVERIRQKKGRTMMEIRDRKGLVWDDQAIVEYAGGKSVPVKSDHGYRSVNSERHDRVTLEWEGTEMPVSVRFEPSGIWISEIE
ncbi:MAG: hypothetical protein IJ721_08985 [Bacteroidales bacterium]|nr:hypothetical protein [Bacteroidales bacterium]